MSSCNQSQAATSRNPGRVERKDCVEEEKNFSELKSESLMGCLYLVAESGSVRWESKAEIKETCLLLR